VKTLCLLAVLGVLAASAVACGSSYRRPESPPPAPASLAPRANCDQIFGTAFRSASERDWFSQNCSHWPPYSPSNSQPGPNSGKPEPNVLAASTPANVPSNVLGVPDRKDCTTIRGTPFLSENERLWYLGNCSQPPPSQQTPSGAGTAPVLQPGVQYQPLSMQPNQVIIRNTSSGAQVNLCQVPANQVPADLAGIRQTYCR